MRIIHTSDWHLGQHFYGKSRAKEHQKFLSWLISQISELKIDVVIVAGDIFDTGTPPSYAREMYFNFIGEIQPFDCQLIVLAGNHDSVAMLGESKDLLASLSTKVITHAVPISASVTEEACDQQPIKEQVFTVKNTKNQAQAVICAVPFIRPRDVIKSIAGQSAQEKQQSLQQAITLHYQALYQRASLLAKESSPPLPIIATGHLTALGVSQSDSVRDIYIGTLEALPSTAFPPADYIALGHIHRAQKVAKSEHIRYSGSPIALSFDEAKQDKRVLMVEFEQGSLARVTDLIVPCFQPLAMIKSTLETLSKDVEKVIDEHVLFDQKRQRMWLDIEIQNSDYLTDLQSRITRLVADFPVEVLLLRRSKQARKSLQESQGLQEKTTLSELTYTEVFASRLAQVEWPTEQELARKKRMTMLFKQTLEQVHIRQELAEKPDENTSALDPKNTVAAPDKKSKINHDASKKSEQGA